MFSVLKAAWSARDCGDVADEGCVADGDTVLTAVSLVSYSWMTITVCIQ